MKTVCITSVQITGVVSKDWGVKFLLEPRAGKQMIFPMETVCSYQWCPYWGSEHFQPLPLGCWAAKAEFILSCSSSPSLGQWSPAEGCLALQGTFGSAGRHFGLSQLEDGGSAAGTWWAGATDPAKHLEGIEQPPTAESSSPNHSVCHCWEA